MVKYEKDIEYCDICDKNVKIGNYRWHKNTALHKRNKWCVKISDGIDSLQEHNTIKKLHELEEEFKKKYRKNPTLVIFQ